MARDKMVALIFSKPLERCTMTSKKEMATTKKCLHNIKKLSGKEKRVQKQFIKNFQKPLARENGVMRFLVIIKNETLR